MIPILFGLTLVIFLMLHLVPGDPAVIMLGNKATDENVERLRENLGLDKPLPLQYVTYLTNLAQGDLGESFVYRQEVRGIVLERIPVTLLLTTYAAILALFITIPLATIGAYRRDRPGRPRCAWILAGRAGNAAVLGGHQSLADFLCEISYLPCRRIWGYVC